MPGYWFFYTFYYMCGSCGRTCHCEVVPHRVPHWLSRLGCTPRLRPLGSVAGGDIEQVDGYSKKAERVEFLLALLFFGVSLKATYLITQREPLPGWA